MEISPLTMAMLSELYVAILWEDPTGFLQIRS